MKLMYAIIETGGKQYKVSGGDVIYVEKLDAEENATVDFKVVAVVDNGDIKLDPKTKVSGTILKTGKGKKITVSTYKPKKGSKRKLGHRQPYTKVEIQSF